MFARFRQTEHRLQVSLVETRRINGKVRHEHVASFGSVEVPPSVEDRITFWQRLHERLAKLSNRVDVTAQAKILGDIHARIPTVTLDEQQAVKLENAKDEERLWSNIHDLHAGTVEDHKGLAAIVERKVAEGQVEMAKAATYRDTAKEQRERLERGEDVPGDSASRGRLNKSYVTLAGAQATSSAASEWPDCPRPSSRRCCRRYVRRWSGLRRPPLTLCCAVGLRRR